VSDISLRLARLCACPPGRESLAPKTSPQPTERHVARARPSTDRRAARQ
jgi:hypothetical protein